MVSFRSPWPVLGRYCTRLFVVVVWCGVLWSLLGEEAFPKEFVEQRREKPCLLLENQSIVQQDIQMLLLGEWNWSSQSIVTVTEVLIDENEHKTYTVSVVQIDEDCLNLLEVRNFVLNVSWNDTPPILKLKNSTNSIDIEAVLNLAGRDEVTSLLQFPDGHFFALTVLLIFSSICGFIAKLIFLPPLFGMIVAGFLLRNVPHVDFAQDISPIWSSTIRNVALVIVLIRGGLALNPKQLKRLKLAVLLLAFGPCILEGAADGIVGTFYLKLPWQWAFMLGYILAAISPAIVVPTALNLQNEGHGTKKGITTLIIAAASMDVAISVSLFGVFLGLVFSEGQLILDIFRAPIQIAVGLLYGILFGALLWFLPTKYFKTGSKVRNQFFLLLGLGLVGLFGSRRAILGGSSLAGAGALAVIVLAFVAGQGWSTDEKASVSRVLLIVWQLAQPLLFGLIGAAVDLDFITPSLVGRGISLIVVGLLLRILASYFLVLGNGFNIKEKLFIAIAWLPKATVQAAVGSFALDIAIQRNEGPEAERLGREVLTIAILAIVLTAPAGAIATSLLGRLLLKKSDEEEQADTERKVVCMASGHCKHCLVLQDYGLQVSNKSLETPTHCNQNGNIMGLIPEVQSSPILVGRTIEFPDIKNRNTSV